TSTLSCSLFPIGTLASGKLGICAITPRSSVSSSAASFSWRSPSSRSDLVSSISAVAARLQIFRLGDCLPPASVKLAKSAQQLFRVHPAMAHALLHFRQMIAHKIQIEHETNLQERQQ